MWNNYLKFLIFVIPLFVSNSAFALEICSCIGKGGVKGVTLWGPKGEPCGGMINGNDLPWGTYSDPDSCRSVKELGKCSGLGGVKGLELWGPPGEVCGGLWKNLPKYTVGVRKGNDIPPLCSCRGAAKSGVAGVTLWGPEGDYCAGIPDNIEWGTYSTNCKY